jgi:site-specific recombinase XerD
MTVTAYLRKSSNDKFGILKIRITENRKSTYVSLKETIKCSDWNCKKNEIRTSCSDYERLTKLINDKIKELDVPNPLIKPITNKTKSFITYILSEIEHLESRGKIGTSKRYRTAYYHIKKFLGTKSDILFSEIDSVFIRDFETYLLKNGNKNNTVKNYVKCIKRLWIQAIKMSHYSHTGADPFIMFVNNRDEVEKRRLTKKEVEMVQLLELKKGDTLFNTKNYFLWQIMSQGLRVSDLMTLRFDTINASEGRIEFLQFKTKSKHSILINEQMVFLLINYVPYDFSEILNQSFKTKEGTFTLNQIREKYKLIKKETLSGLFKNPTKEKIDKVQHWNTILLDIQRDVAAQILLGIIEYSKTHPNDFIFPILKNEDFTDVLFSKEISLTKYQYNQLQSKTTIYNKNLKKLQKLAGIETVLTSHLQRHTFTNILLENTDDVYVVSKTLGHKRLSTTETYMSNFIKSKVDEPVVNLSNMFSVV